MKKLLTLLLFSSFISYGQSDTTKAKSGATETQVKQSKKWFESISIRGYMQVRYNRLGETNSKLKCDQCDRSWGENGGYIYSAHADYFLWPDT